MPKWKNARKLALIKKHGQICFYCGRGGQLLTIDHKHPVSLGGGNKERNLVLSCLKCNQEKSARGWKEYLVYRVKANLSISREARFYVPTSLALDLWK